MSERARAAQAIGRLKHAGGSPIVQPARERQVIEQVLAHNPGPLTREHLERIDTRVEYQQMHAPRIWLPDREGGLLVPNPILQAVVSWMSRVQS